MNAMKYPSDISREDFEKIRPELEGFKKRTNPRIYDLYDIFCAVLYVVKTGCQWRALPHDYPRWEAVYRYFKQWKTPRANGSTLLEELLKKL
jgi:transposase